MEICWYDGAEHWSDGRFVRSGISRFSSGVASLRFSKLRVHEYSQRPSCQTPKTILSTIPFETSPYCIKKNEWYHPDVLLISFVIMYSYVDLDISFGRILSSPSPIRTKRSGFPLILYVVQSQSQRFIRSSKLFLENLSFSPVKTRHSLKMDINSSSSILRSLQRLLGSLPVSFQKYDFTLSDRNFRKCANSC
jgi:hypothetical protein